MTGKQWGVWAACGPVSKSILMLLPTTLVLSFVFLSVGCGTGDSSGISTGHGDSDEVGIEAAANSSVGVASTGTTQMQFVDRASEAGIQFTVRNGEEAGRFAIVESLGAGVSLIDVDADRQLDIIIPGGGEFVGSVPVGLPFALFRQLEKWKFEESSNSAMLPVPESFSHGVSVADFDADGFSDILATGFREIIVLRNNGDGTFSDVTADSEIASTGWSTGSVWADFTGDGVLDLYVVNYVDWSPANSPECLFGGRRDVCSPKHFQAETDTLWIGTGDGSFSAVDRGAGLQQGGKGLAALAADIDLDGDVDIYVANDTTPNFLYWNDGGGNFSEAGIFSGTALGDPAEADGSMGVDLGDFNNDGLPDLWVANYERQAFALYRSEGSGLFQHVSSVSGITSVGQSFVGFGTVVRDFDLDGDQDIAVANGHVMQNSVNSPVRQQPLLFENDGEARFQNVAADSGEYFRSDHVGRGLCSGDLDGDGDVDLIVSHTNSPIAVLENRSVQMGARLSLRLVGRNYGRDAIGAAITVSVGDRQWRSQITSGGSYLAESDRTAILGGWTESAIVTVRVDWPGGGSSEKSMKTGDNATTLVEGALALDVDGF